MQTEGTTTTTTRVAAAAAPTTKTLILYWLTFGKQMFCLCRMPNWLFPFRTFLFLFFFFVCVSFERLYTTNYECEFCFFFSLSVSFFLVILGKHTPILVGEKKRGQNETCKTKSKKKRNKRTNLILWSIAMLWNQRFYGFVKQTSTLIRMQ